MRIVPYTPEILAERATEAEREALIALSALAAVIDPRVANDVKTKVEAAFKANADFMRAVADVRRKEKENG